MEVSVPSLRGAAESVWEAVVPVLPAFTVEVLAQIDSTNTELMRRARAGQTAPTLLVAERQTAGRGRLGRDWHSATAPQDGALASLTFSLGMALPAMDFSGLSLAAGLAVVQSLHPALRLKWPNDVWVHDRKLGGILIETAAAGDQRFLVVGVGLNILPVTQSGLRMPAAALVDVLPDADAASALLCVAPALVAALQTFAQHGFAAFETAFATRDTLYNRTVQTSGAGVAAVVGVARGVDSRGALQVHTAQGLVTISSSEVSVRPSESLPLSP